MHLISRPPFESLYLGFACRDGISGMKEGVVETRKKKERQGNIFTFS